MGKKHVFFKKENIGLFICCLFCFVAHAIVMNQFNGWFCTDTDGYWLHAATFTGHDWSGVASKVSMYYAWGYSVVLVLPFVISNDILVMSKIAVLINSMFCALTIPLLYSIGRKIFQGVDKRILMAAALITSLYSSYFIGSAVALAETFIYFLYVLLMWLVLQYMDTHKWYWAMLSGVCCGYLYITHHRNLGMVAAFVILTLIQIIKNRNWKELAWHIIPLVVMICLDLYVNDWLNAKEMAGGVYTTNTYGSMENRLLRIFSLSGIVAFVQSILGELWYMLAGTFTIAGIGAIGIIRNIVKQKEGVSFRECIFNKKCIYSIYIFLNILMTMGVSAVFCMKGSNSQSRIDAIFYGRYFECTICILLFFGLISLWTIRNNTAFQNDIRIVFLLTVCLSIIVYFFTQEISGKGINYFSVAAVLFPFSYPNLGFSVVTSSICLLMMAGVFIKLVLCNEMWYRIFSYILVAGSFIYVGYNGIINVRDHYAEQAVIASYPTCNEEFVVMSNCIGELDVETLYIYTENGYDAFSYQLFHPDIKVMTVNITEEMNEQSGGYVIFPINNIVEDSEMEIVMETPNYVMCKIE